MIRVQKTFIDPSVKRAGSLLFEQVSSLEKGLQHLALEFSIFGNTPWKKIKEVFVETGTQHYPLSDRHYAYFVEACTKARRSEASIRLERLSGYGWCLALTFKFYHKEDRRCFFEWKMAFDRQGQVAEGGVTGHDQIGTLIMK